jgi:hypothetical protein
MLVMADSNNADITMVMVEIINNECFPSKTHLPISSCSVLVSGLTDAKTSD